MFDVSVYANGVTFTGINVNIGLPGQEGGAGANTQALLSIYTRPGTYVGGETQPGQWLLRSSNPVTSNGTNLPTFVSFTDFGLGAGSTSGFYVTQSNYNVSTQEMLYTDGTTAYSNIALQIASGIGCGNPDFSGGVFSPASGTVRSSTTIRRLFRSRLRSHCWRWGRLESV